MKAAEIRALLAEPDIEQANRETVLFLNSQFPSRDDLEGLDVEFHDSRVSEAELLSSLASSSSMVEKLISETSSTAHLHLETAQNLSLLRHSLTDELVDLTDGLLSSISSEPGNPTLLEDIEALHRNLSDLQGVKGYAQVIKHVLELSESSIQQIESLPSSVSISTSSVTQFQTLQAFVATVANVCSSVEDGAGKQSLHLVNFLERVRDRTWIDIKRRVSTPLLNAGEQLQWPMSVDYAKASTDERTAFEHAFLRLLQLQRVSESIKAKTSDSLSEKDGIYPLEILVQPVALRFKYHFEGTRPTNRPDKPEWYFTHVLNVAHDHRSFMDHVIQHLLKSGGHNNVNAWREFTRLLLPLLTNKLRKTIPSLLPHPSLLAHTIYQALQFDAALQVEEFSLDGTLAKAKESWAGISDIVLGNKEWFDTWLDGERRFTESQYHDIIGASDAWKIANDGQTDEETSSGPDPTTTNSARRLKALIEQVTDRYSPLPSFLHRTRFLLSTQVPLLEQYLGRLAASLDAYETLSSALVRAVPGALGVSLGVKEDSSSVNVDTGRLTSGVEGVQRLCKALLSARFIEAAMEVWGEDLFFLELWTEINQKAPLRALAQANSTLPLSNGDDGSQNTIFETLINKYHKVCDRSQDIIVQQICAEVESNLKAHFSATASINPVSTEDDFTLSQTLLRPIAVLSAHLIHMRTLLPQQILTAVYRHVASRLAEHILQRQILYRGAFSPAEGKIIHAECDVWVQTCLEVLVQTFGGSRNRVEAPWLRLIEAGRLVGIDGEARNRVVDATFGAMNEEGWEDVMLEVMGSNELSREEVERILRRETIR
ncbi:hypothetical protein D9757_006987 [Collybiopsis confluens]|uniref:Uncharacterized protein n=1 Tax=Collybiopsis confluens TaxID=2823264 RepID=A0A8H5HIM5_9AGAR|nr:hypothetical protein D9757_006987 [Collybiopsis confluens]